MTLELSFVFGMSFSRSSCVGKRDRERKATNMSVQHALMASPATEMARDEQDLTVAVA